MAGRRVVLFQTKLKKKMSELYIVLINYSSRDS